MPIPSRIVAIIAMDKATSRYISVVIVTSCPKSENVDIDFTQFRMSMVRMPVKFVKLTQTSITETATSSRNSWAMIPPASARAVRTLRGALRISGSMNSRITSRITAQKPAESGSPAEF